MSFALKGEKSDQVTEGGQSERVAQGKEQILPLAVHDPQADIGLALFLGSCLFSPGFSEVSL